MSSLISFASNGCFWKYEGFQLVDNTVYIVVQLQIKPSRHAKKKLLRLIQIFQNVGSYHQTPFIMNGVFVHIGSEHRFAFCVKCIVALKKIRLGRRLYPQIAGTNLSGSSMGMI